MARFANTAQKPGRSPTSLGPTPKPIRTFEYGQGFKADDAHVELFNAAVNGFLADDFYEHADDRINRIIGMVPLCDPEWLKPFIEWLRDEAHMRSAPLVLAAEYARAKFPNSRGVIASAIKRADEPGEMLGYWYNRYGRSLPASVKRGIADAVTRMYSEHNLLRYDGVSRNWRFGDVIEVVHAKPHDAAQSALFKFALDRRRHPEAVPMEGQLRKVVATLALEALPQEQRSLELLNADTVFSWERASGWLGRPLTKLDWETLLPTMGYFAILRNLNNFDKAGVDPEIVADYLVDVQKITFSRVMPFRFLTAYKAVDSDNYKIPLAVAANQALDNLPLFPGTTLIMVDASGSMGDVVGAGKSRNPLFRADLAGFFAEALARRCEHPTIFAYDTTLKPVPFKAHVSVLTAASNQLYQPMGGTNTWRMTEAAYSGQNRVIILTDEQAADTDQGKIKVPIITWNLAGYEPHHTAHGSNNRFFVAGVTDTVLQTLPAVIARGSTGRWPWE